ncbi:dimethyl sulfoxide reductase anchor subunit family protein [Vibrio methylphosphonaticus]|uniref:dimethyl sulfoxide reductase anchor subunit family protein n=1 Tax=Vibrio methylphosphonaticus TaxID=2946866 RepID=UPI002029B7C5|nr:DmsC/YnfH family molybdoenzyme membrane anchor subunit [Vibrio methylphosphonaticus]MCL9774470.1 dimethyl sulfoxide reductase anchor subunit [Vibrio methylphosphonaticus]
MGWHEWPLIIFTVFAQTAVGAFIVLGCLNLFGKASDDVKARINRNMFFIWVFMGLGFMASTAHLGSPMRAINALNQIGTSWLSREILFGSAFFAFGGLFWLLDVLKKGSIAIRKGLLVGGMLMGVVFMVAMTNVYLINTVPTWDTPFTTYSFAITAILSGVMLSHVLMRGAGFQCAGYNRAAGTLVVVTTGVAVLVTMAMVSSLSGIESAIVAASDLVPNMAMIQNTRFALIFVGVALWVMSLRKQDHALPFAVSGFALVVIAELIGRSVFFGLHMTSGM